MKSRTICVLILLCTLLSGAASGTAQQVCGMWAGPLNVMPNPDPCNPWPPKYLLTGQGVFSGCCGGPGCWPTITIINLRTLQQTWVEVGGCGGGNTTYSYTFVANPPHYSIGDGVMFIRGNRTLSNPPQHCPGSISITVADFPPSANPPHNSTPQMTQVGISDDMGGCVGGKVSTWGCLLLSYTMVLNFHFAKHGIPGVTWQDLDAAFLERGAYDPNGCARLLATAENAVVAYGRERGIPGFGLVACGGGSAGIDRAICEHGPVIVKTRSHSQPSNPDKSHYVVAIDRGGTIRNSAGNPTSLSGYGNVIRGCRVFTSAPATPFGDAPTSTGYELAITAPELQKGLLLTDANGQRSGLDSAGSALTEIPGSEADVWGGISAPLEPEVWYPDSVVVRVRDAGDVYVLERDGATAATTIRAAALGEQSVDNAAFELGVPGPDRVAVAAVPTGTGVHLSAVPLIGTGGPMVVSTPTAAPGTPAATVVGPGGRNQTILFEGVMWPHGLQDWELVSLLFETSGGVGVYRALELWLDTDHDGQLTIADQRVATGSFETDRMWAAHVGVPHTGPIRVFLLEQAEQALEVGVPAPRVRMGATGIAATLAALLLFGLLGGPSRRVRRTSMPFCATTMILLGVVLLPSCHRSRRAAPPLAQTVAVSLTFAEATDGQSQAAVVVEGLPTAGRSVTR